MSMTGTYVRGWKFNWDEAQKDFIRYMEAGQEFRAASCADPGCCMCPTCGEHHWREFEVFLCSRCGAELTISNYNWDCIETAPPKFPEKIRPLLIDGMRVKYLGREYIKRNKTIGRLDGMWPAGRIPVGTTGTIRKGKDRESMWLIDWDSITPKPGFQFGLFGPFLQDDEYEIIKSCNSTSN